MVIYVYLRKRKKDNNDAEGRCPNRSLKNKENINDEDIIYTVKENYDQDEEEGNAKLENFYSCKEDYYVWLNIKIQ